MNQSCRQVSGSQHERQATNHSICQERNERDELHVSGENCETETWTQDPETSVCECSIFITYINMSAEPDFDYIYQCVL